MTGIRTAVAEIYEAVGDPRAKAARELAAVEDDAEVDERYDVASLMDDLRAELNAPGVPKARGPHDETCYLRHVPCFATRLGAIIDESGW